MCCFLKNCKKYNEWLKELSGWNTKYRIVSCPEIANHISDIALNERCLQFKFNLNDSDIQSRQKLDSDFWLTIENLC